MDYKIIFGYIAVILSFIGILPYFINIFKNKTKPHAFSWLTWGIAGGIVFFAQIFKHAGPGAYATGLGTLICFIIFFIALKKGQRQFSTFDWSSLLVSLLAIILWIFTNDPTLSVILVTLNDMVGFLPSIRKGYYFPFEETATTYSLASIKWIFAIIALQNYSLASWLYPASLIITNGAFTGMLLIRRKQLNQSFGK